VGGEQQGGVALPDARQAILGSVTAQIDVVSLTTVDLYSASR
jgi:hypothetical protein